MFVSEGRSLSLSRSFSTSLSSLTHTFYPRYRRDNTVERVCVSNSAIKYESRYHSLVSCGVVRGLTPASWTTTTTTTATSATTTTASRATTTGVNIFSRWRLKRTRSEKLTNFWKITSHYFLVKKFKEKDSRLLKSQPFRDRQKKHSNQVVEEKLWTEFKKKRKIRLAETKQASTLALLIGCISSYCLLNSGH